MRKIDPTKINCFLIELRHLGLNALKASVVRRLQDVWAAYPAETIIGVYETLIKRASTDAIKVMFAAFLTHRTLLSVIESMGRDAPMVLLALPIRRVPIARMCHGIVGLSRNMGKVGQFVDKRLLDTPLVKVVVLNPKIAGNHASACGKVVMKLNKHHEDTEERLFQEIESLYMATALNALNLSVAFNDFVVCRSSDSKTQVFMDYGGHTISSEQFTASMHTSNAVSSWLSITVQVCMALYSFHAHTGRSHSDVNWGNVIVSPWPRSMGQRLVYAFPTAATTDCSPISLVSFPREFALKDDMNENVPALTIEDPQFRVHIIDWGLSSSFEDMPTVQAWLSDSNDYDFVAGFEAWQPDHPVRESTDDVFGVFAPWWNDAECAGDFMLSALEAYEKQHKASIIYAKLDPRLVDYYAFLVPLFVWWSSRNDTVFSGWVRAFIGRLALPWLTTGDALTDADMKLSLNDAFRYGLFAALFDTPSAVLPTWRTSFPLFGSVHNRDKDSYVVMMRDNTVDVYKEIVDCRDQLVRLTRKEI